MRSCSTCRFFVQFKSGNTEIGECHFTAPIIFIPTEDIRAHKTGVWPIVRKDWGCGEHEEV